MTEEKKRRIEERMKQAISNAEIRRLAHVIGMDPTLAVERFGKFKVAPIEDTSSDNNKREED